MLPEYQLAPIDCAVVCTGIVAGVWNGVVGPSYQEIEDRHVRQVDWRTVIMKVNVETRGPISPYFPKNIWIRGRHHAGISGR